MGQDSTGKKIKEAREKAGLTQSQLAEAVGTTSQNISQYERGLRKPKYETLLKIAKALNVEWYSLFVATSDAELAEARTIKLYTSTGTSVEEAQEIFNDHRKCERIAETIDESIGKLNEAGTMAAGHLIASIATKFSNLKEHDPNNWMFLIMQCYFSESEQYEEVKRGIDALLQIPAYQKEADSDKK